MKIPEILGSQQCVPREGWPAIAPQARRLGFHPRTLPQGNGGPSSTRQPRWPYSGLAPNAHARDPQTVRGVALWVWHTRGSPQGIQQRSSDLAGSVMRTCSLLSALLGEFGSRTSRVEKPWWLGISVHGNATMPNIRTDSWQATYGGGALANFAVYLQDHAFGK